MAIFYPNIWYDNVWGECPVRASTDVIVMFRKDAGNPNVFGHVGSAGGWRWKLLNRDDDIVKFRLNGFYEKAPVKCILKEPEDEDITL